MFVATAEFLPQHRAQQQATLQVITAAEAATRPANCAQPAARTRPASSRPASGQPATPCTPGSPPRQRPPDQHEPLHRHGRSTSRRSRRRRTHRAHRDATPANTPTATRHHSRNQAPAQSVTRHARPTPESSRPDTPGHPPNPKITQGKGSEFTAPPRRPLLQPLLRCIRDVCDQLRPGAHGELAQYAGDMELNGFLANSELDRDLLI